LTSRAYHTTTLGEFGSYITSLLGYEKFFPMNGGVESVETACKLARRWAYRHKGVPDNEAVILFPKNCFWGRSITASGACDDPLRFTQMGPFTGGFELFDYDSPSALEAMLKSNPNICAVVLEPIKTHSECL
jgi:ornithine--oxo-acid transaminase